MKQLKAITLDLWGTIFYPKGSGQKVERRRAMILEALLEAGLDVDVERLRAAYRAAAKLIEADIAKQFQDLGPPGPDWETGYGLIHLPAQ